MRTAALQERRNRQILADIVRTYIESGEPVSSRAISARFEETLSTATIRNIMADLEEGGFLYQPHTSAGRVPTDKAFRDFAASVPARPLPHAERQRIYASMQSANSLEDRVATASSVLTEFTHNVGIATALPV